MGYKSFEELEVYKAAREFRKKIYKLIKGCCAIFWEYANEAAVGQFRQRADKTGKFNN